MGEVNDTARRLLREMGYQVEGSPTSDVQPREAAEHLGLDPGSREYELALEHLRSLGDIEPSSDLALLVQGFYQLTVQGRRRASELRFR